MKTLLKLAALTSAALLASCGDTPEEKAAKLAALKVCPAAKVLTDISSYSVEMPDASLAQTEWLAANGKCPAFKQLRPAYNTASIKAVTKKHQCLCPPKQCGYIITAYFAMAPHLIVHMTVRKTSSFRLMA